MPIQPSDSSLEAQFTLESSKTGVIDDPPFHILALGDWSGDGEKKPVAERTPIEIDRDNFDEVIARLKARVDLDLDESSSLRLEFRSLDDFHPDEIFRRVSLFSDLRDLRKRLKDSDTFNSAAREVRERGTDAPFPDTVKTDEGVDPPADNLLDAILSKPSGGAAAPKSKVSGELGGLIGELVRPHLVSVDENEQASLVAAVDSATGSLMRTILHHPKFQHLEAAWRALYFLVRRTETSSELKIYIIDVSKDELSADLKSATDLAGTQLYKVLVRDTVETPGGEPWSLVCANYAYSPNIDDIAALMRVSKICNIAGAPFVSHMRPDVIGVHSLTDHVDPAEWKLSDESDAGKLWSALRGQNESKYLGMTIPRFLVRLPYGADTDPLETFSFEEFVEGRSHDLYVWANGAFLAALLLAQSFSASGWEMGRSLTQDVEGLPVHIYEEGGETIFKPCAEIQMTDRGVDKLMEFGLMPIVSYRNTDRVKLARFQSIADPVTGLKGRWSA